MGTGLVLVWAALLGGYDIRCRRLPNWLTLPGAAVILGVAVVTDRGVPALAGAVALFGGYLAVHVAAPAALGGGDVKLALGLGALTGCFGAAAWLLAAVAAPVLTGLWALAVLVVRGERAVPHGPSMCLASVAAVALTAPEVFDI